jgi:RNA polymerase sigma-70 factor, ECF subfamily
VKRAGGNFPDRPGVSNNGSNVSDDAQLIDQALSGHSEAFGQLVLRYQDRLFNTIFHITGNAEDARDVVQEALVQAFLKLESFQHRSAFYTWVYRITVNVAMNHRRRRRPTVSIDRLREQTRFEPVDNEHEPGGAMQRTQQCQQVRAAIAQLPAEFRSVLVLREIDGCDYETISDILDLPIGTVRSRLHRARLQLRDALAEINE